MVGWKGIRPVKNPFHYFPRCFLLEHVEEMDTMVNRLIQVHCPSNLNGSSTVVVSLQVIDLLNKRTMLQVDNE